MQPRHATQDGFGFQFAHFFSADPDGGYPPIFCCLHEESKEIKGTDEASIQGGVPQKTR